MRYILEPYKPGGTNRFNCPQCGKRKCFTPYLDTKTATYVNPEQCGRCDHEASCGYHLKPREYFQLNPYERSRHPTYSPHPSAEYAQNHFQPLPVAYLPDHLITDTHSPHSQFVNWLHTIVPNPDAIKQTYEAYRLGATKTGGVIFWQIDTEGRLRTGKVMHYHPDGHRVKDADDFARLLKQPLTERTPQPLYFYHKRLIRQGVIPQDHRIEQCLFGEHLLPMQPNATVCLVESEKTAIVCSICYPQFLWLATGGCKQLSLSKLAPLRKRSLIIYPDSGEYTLWSSIMQRTEGFDYRIVKALERYPKNTDIADVLLGEKTIVD